MKKMFLALTLASLGWAGSAQADTVLLQDNFNDAPNAGQASFNNNLATTQTGSSLGTIAYSLATENGSGGEFSTNAWQHGDATKQPTGDMLLNGRANVGGNNVVFAGLNHNFATDANSANLPLVIEFNIWVTDPDTTTWEAVNIGNTQNVWVNAGGTKFGSLFTVSGSTQQFPAPNNNGITYNQGDQIRLVLSDSTGNHSAFNSSGTSVVKMYQNGTLVHTFTGLSLAATDGYVSFQSYFAAGYIANLKISLKTPPPLSVSISPMNPAVAVSSNETFTATATGGSGSYTYQWQQNSTNLVGQTGATLALNNVAQTMNGYTYAVVVNDGLNNATSAVSTLTVGMGNPFAADWHNQIVAGNAAIYGSTVDENNGKITLTTGTGQNGSAVIKDLTPGAQVGNFNAAFDVGLSGSGCWADGYSFNFAPLPGDNGTNFAEVGSGTGFAVAVPTYNQGDPAKNPNVIYVKWNGVTIAQGSMPTFVSSTTMNVSVDALGNFSVTFGANPAITGIIPASGWQATVKTGWRFVLSARCGGCGETCEIGNTTIIAPPVTSIAGVTASQSISYGTANVSLSGTVSAGAGYPADGETVSVTINGSTQNATIAGGAGGFSINFPTAAIPPAATAYTITYAYAGDANLNAAANDTSTALTVTGIKVPNLTYTNAPGVARIITLAEIQTAGLASSQASPVYSITVGSTSNGGTVITNSAGTLIKYTNSPAFSPTSDSFSYTVSDSVASASGTVTINFASVAGPQLTPTVDGSNHPVISFHGIPGYSYHIQRATTLANGGDWADVQPITLLGNGDGSATWTDTSKTVPPDNVYYRLSYP